jgi:hypothetical protein
MRRSAQRRTRKANRTADTVGSPEVCRLFPDEEIPEAVHGDVELGAVRTEDA